MIVKLLTEHHLEFLSLNGGYTGSSESTHVKMPHCRKSHATAHIIIDQLFLSFQADATAWMAVYSLNMLEISLLLSKNDVENKDRYDNLALMFFQRFLEISDSMNGETGRTLFFNP